MESLYEKILNCFYDSVTNVLYYDRKECEDLKVGQIEQAIIDDVITVDEIVKEFRLALEDAVEEYRNPYEGN